MTDCINESNVQVIDIEQSTIDEINSIIKTSGLFDDLDEAKRDRVKATVNVAVRIGHLLLSQVFNQKYYPLMDNGQEAELSIKYLLYTVLNVLYPYTKDSANLRQIINSYWKAIQDYCVENYLLYVLDDKTDVSNMIAYLADTFYNLY